MKILIIDSSIKGDRSVSRQIVADFRARLTAAEDGASISYVDLVETPLPYLTPAVVAARMGFGAASDPAYLAHEAALDAFLAADYVVVGAPMYNFGIPAQLKSWLDALAVAGKTFRYTEKGAEGLCGSKRIVVVSSRGGFYEPPSPQASSEHQESHLISFFAILGINKIEIIRAEGTDISPESRSAALANARDQLDRLALSATLHEAQRDG